MKVWQTRLRRLVERGDCLPEALASQFETSPASGALWPETLPACPLLAELYGLCDGGRFSPYTIYPLDQIEAATAEVKQWVDDDELDSEGLVEGQWFIFGEHGEVNSHVLVWNADCDRVGVYSSDNGWTFDNDGSWPLIPNTLERFLTLMFFPTEESDDELERDWYQALKVVDEST